MKIITQPLNFQISIVIHSISRSKLDSLTEQYDFRFLCRKFLKTQKFYVKLTLVNRDLILPPKFIANGRSKKKISSSDSVMSVSKSFSFDD